MTTREIDEQLEVLRTTQIELMSSMIKGLAEAVAENNKAIRLITGRLTALEKKLDRAQEFLPDLGNPEELHRWQARQMANIYPPMKGDDIDTGYTAGREP